MNPQLLTTTAGVDRAFWFILGVCVVMLILITVLMVYFSIRYHRSRHPRPTSDAHGNLLLELAWTALPTAIVMAMFWYGWTGYMGLRNVPQDAMEIQAEGRMWSWSFTYPDGRVTDKLVVPAGKPVKVHLTTADVLHSFYVPAFRVKKDAIPGRTTYVWFNATRPGSYDIFCTEYCGLGHSSMLSRVEALSADAYHSWLTAKPGPAAKPGEALLTKHGCIGCHSLDGTKSIGPTFKGMMNRQETVVTPEGEKMITADADYLKRSILLSKAEIVKGYPAVMPDFADKLTDDEVAQIIEVIASLP